VTGLTGLVSKVAVTLSNVNHAFPDDVDVLLAGPSGQKLVLMSDAGGGHPCMNLVLTFDDAAVASLSDSAQLSAGTNKPTDYEPGDVFPAPAPPGSAGATLSVFNGTTPNGDWSLYVSDDSMGDAGIIADGWSLNLTVVNPINPAADVSIVATDAPDPLLTSAILTYSVNVTNHGPAAATGVRVADTLPAGVNFVSATASQGSCTNAGNTVICNLGSLAAGNQATLTVVVTPTQAGAIANTFTVTANETDLNLANSTAQVMTMVTNPSLAHLAGTVVPTNGYFQLTLTGQPGQTHAIEVSTNLFGWIKVHTNTTAGNGTFKFTDTNAPSFKYRFYRAVRLP